MNIKNKKILVTGGSGFIGSHLADKLKTMGADITLFDKSKGHDITDQSQLKKYIQKKFDVIYHLAGFSGAEKSQIEKLKCFEINNYATINLLEMIIKYSPRTKIILSSSRQEYGKPLYLPVDEVHPTNPISIYGLSKLISTQLGLMYYQKNNLDVTIFRTSNVYGPHPKDKFSGYNVINYFMDLALKNKNITVFGKGNQLRDYIYIDDLLDAFLRSLNKKSSGEIYNLGYGKGIRFKDMIKLITKTAGKGNIVYKSWPQNSSSLETGSYVSDISKLKNDLGFRPKIDFEEGIKKSIGRQ